MSEEDELFKQQAEAGIRRDRWGRPLVIQPGDESVEPYTRVSTLAKALDDTHNLMAWAGRMTAKGISISPDLIAAFAAMPDPNADRDTKKLADEYVEQAKERAKANQRRVLGSAIHSFTDQIDQGKTPEHVPADVAPDLRAYVAATTNIRWLAFEKFVVLDDLKVAGTMDRLGVRKGAKLPRAVDLKTGSVGDYNALGFACQLAMYARGVPYSADGSRTPWPGPIDLEVGEIIHVAQGQGKVTIYECDLTRGWEAVQLALKVRALRKDKALMSERVEMKTTMQRIASATTLDELREIWIATKDTWTEKEKKFAEHMAEDIRKRT
jgi:PD-(D/E)XK nuclease superfamily